MGKKKKKDGSEDNVLARNRKARHEYTILDTMEAGIELRGTEVKSCRARAVSIGESFVRIEKGEAVLFHAHIAEYEHGNRFNHQPLRPRKLLLHKSEILKLSQKTREKGLTIIALKMYLARGKVKIQIGIAKGKSHSDKRDTLRKRQDDMEARRALGSRV